MVKFLIPEVLGDNWLLKEWDWELDGSSQSLINKIKKLPKVILTNIQNRNQMVSHRRWDAGCTWVSWLNLVWTIMGKELTDAILNEWERMAKEDWWVEWKGWYRWSWLNVARKLWNKLYPNNQIQTYVVDIDSAEAKAYLATGRPVHTSINVDWYFWVQANAGKVDKNNFGTRMWHATIHKDWDWYKVFLDSVWKKRDDKFWSVYSVTDGVIKSMFYNKLRKDVHIVLPDNIIPMIAQDVPSWQRYSDWVKFLIEEWLTTETEKFKPNDMMTRAEMATFLKRFYDKFIKKD